MNAPGIKDEDPPPLFSSWGKFYGAVLFFLLLVIGFLYGFSQWFSEVLP